MAETATPIQDDVYRRLSAVAEALVARDGVGGLMLVTGGGSLVMRFGRGPQPDTETTLTRLSSAVSVASQMARDGGTVQPVFVQDERNRIYARPLKYGLIIFVCCDERLLSGQAYRLVDEPAALMREALDDLFGATRSTPRPSRPAAYDDDVFWE